MFFPVGSEVQGQEKGRSDWLDLAMKPETPVHKLVRQRRGTSITDEWRCRTRRDRVAGMQVSVGLDSTPSHSLGAETLASGRQDLPGLMDDPFCAELVTSVPFTAPVGASILSVSSSKGRAVSRDGLGLMVQGAPF